MSVDPEPIPIQSFGLDHILPMPPHSWPGVALFSTAEPPHDSSATARRFLHAIQRVLDGSPFLGFSINVQPMNQPAGGGERGPIVDPKEQSVQCCKSIAEARLAFAFLEPRVADTGAWMEKAQRSDTPVILLEQVPEPNGLDILGPAYIEDITTAPPEVVGHLPLSVRGRQLTFPAALVRYFDRYSLMLNFSALWSVIGERLISYVHRTKTATVTGWSETVVGFIARRRQLGLRRAELASLVGCSEAMIAALESGPFLLPTLSSKEKERFLRPLGVSLAEVGPAEAGDGEPIRRYQLVPLRVHDADGRSLKVAPPFAEPKHIEDLEQAHSSLVEHARNVSDDPWHIAGDRYELAWTSARDNSFLPRVFLDGGTWKPLEIREPMLFDDSCPDRKLLACRHGELPKKEEQWRQLFKLLEHGEP